MKLSDALAKLAEANDFGQFSDDHDQPQAKPVRAALRVVAEVNVASLVADGERLRYLLAIMFAAEGGDPTARQVMDNTPAPEYEAYVTREAVTQAFRDNIDAMRAKWQPLEWD